MPTKIKIILIPLLLLCLAPMPYGYYVLVRWFSTLAFAYLGYHALQHEVQNLPWVYFGLAALFQPIVKLALGRPLWNAVDVAVAAFLVVTILINQDNR